MNKLLKRITLLGLVLCMAFGVGAVAAACGPTEQEETYTVSAEFDATKGTVAVSSPADGTAYKKDEQVTVTVTANTGYEVDAFTVNGTAQTLTEGQYTFAIQSNTTVTATFKDAVATPTMFHVTATYTSSQGTVTLSPAAADGNYAENTEITVTVTAATGYVVQSVLLGTEAKTLTDGKFTFTVTADVEITVTFVSAAPTLGFTADYVGTWKSVDGEKIVIAEDSFVLTGASGTEIASTVTKSGDVFTAKIENTDYTVSVSKGVLALQGTAGVRNVYVKDPFPADVTKPTLPDTLYTTYDNSGDEVAEGDEQLVVDANGVKWGEHAVVVLADVTSYYVTEGADVPAGTTLYFVTVDGTLNFLMVVPSDGMGTMLGIGTDTGEPENMFIGRAVAGKHDYSWPGAGTEASPFTLTSLVGDYEVWLQQGNAEWTPLYFTFTLANDLLIKIVPDQCNPYLRFDKKNGDAWEKYWISSADSVSTTSRTCKLTAGDYRMKVDSVGEAPGFSQGQTELHYKFTVSDQDVKPAFVVNVNNETAVGDQPAFWNSPAYRLYKNHSATSNGTEITAEDIAYGDTITVVFNPKNNYALGAVKLYKNGEQTGTELLGTAQQTDYNEKAFTLTIDGDTRLAVTAKQAFKLTVTGTGATYTTAPAQSAYAPNETATVTLTPNAGYSIATVSVKVGVLGTPTTYTIASLKDADPVKVDANGVVTVTVTFSTDAVTVSYTTTVKFLDNVTFDTAWVGTWKCANPATVSANYELALAADGLTSLTTARTSPKPGVVAAEDGSYTIAWARVRVYEFYTVTLKDGLITFTQQNSRNPYVFYFYKDDALPTVTLPTEATGGSAKAYTCTIGSETHTIYLAKNSVYYDHKLVTVLTANENTYTFVPSGTKASLCTLTIDGATVTLNETACTAKTGEVTILSNYANDNYVVTTAPDDAIDFGKITITANSITAEKGGYTFVLVDSEENDGDITVWVFLIKDTDVHLAALNYLALYSIKLDGSGTGDGFGNYLLGLDKTVASDKLPVSTFTAGTYVAPEEDDFVIAADGSVTWNGHTVTVTGYANLGEGAGTVAYVTVDGTEYVLTTNASQLGYARVLYLTEKDGDQPSFGFFVSEKVDTSWAGTYTNADVDDLVIYENGVVVWGNKPVSVKSGSAADGYSVLVEDVTWTLTKSGTTLVLKESVTAGDATTYTFTAKTEPTPTTTDFVTLGYTVGTYKDNSNTYDDIVINEDGSATWGSDSVTINRTEEDIGGDVTVYVTVGGTNYGFTFYAVGMAGKPMIGVSGGDIETNAYFILGGAGDGGSSLGLGDFANTYVFSVGSAEETFGEVVILIDADGNIKFVEKQVEEQVEIKSEVTAIDYMETMSMPFKLAYCTVEYKSVEYKLFVMDGSQIDIPATVLLSTDLDLEVPPNPTELADEESVVATFNVQGSGSAPGVM